MIIDQKTIQRSVFWAHKCFIRIQSPQNASTDDDDDVSVGKQVSAACVLINAKRRATPCKSATASYAHSEWVGGFAFDATTRNASEINCII